MYQRSWNNLSTGVEPKSWSVKGSRDTANPLVMAAAQLLKLVQLQGFRQCHLLTCPPIQEGTGSLRVCQEGKDGSALPLTPSLCYVCCITCYVMLRYIMLYYTTLYYIWYHLQSKRGCKALWPFGDPAVASLMFSCSDVKFLAIPGLTATCENVKSY